ncbi:MAG: hypothetical protein LBU35_00770 [Holosporales bacterium]|nr:hypothetical protein [Holosporales bacterium]
MSAFLISVVYAQSSKEPSDINKQVETYMNSLDCVYSRFFQIRENKGYSGNFWLRKYDGLANVRIEYTEGLKQNILIHGDKVIINDGKKKKTLSISRTPVFSVLSGKLDLSKENTEIIENSNEILRLKIKAYKSGELTLLFSKYKTTRNIQALEGWIFFDGKSETLFTFDPDTWSVKDKRKTPLKIFNID